MEHMKCSTGHGGLIRRALSSTSVLVLLMVASTVIVCQLRVNSLQPKLQEIEELIRENKLAGEAAHARRERRGATDVIEEFSPPFAGGLQGGAVFTHWGREACAEQLETVYAGKVGGSDHNKHGGGSNYICVPTLNVTWDKYVDGPNSKTFLYGAEFENPGTGFFSTENAQAIESLQDYDVPCAVCRVPTHRSVVTIPAWTSCPSGWTRQYRGYLMTGHESHKGRNKFECVDSAPDIFKGTYENKNGALFYLVEAVCGSLPCGPYIANRQITCVVCSI
ncbi:uncharacterized protein LOC144910173 [Branchiostoma floridae x Branchiostoma belcheri]